jgi:tetratricopeptide (TPR) repeat protein
LKRFQKEQTGFCYLCPKPPLCTGLLLMKRNFCRTLHLLPVLLILGLTNSFLFAQRIDFEKNAIEKMIAKDYKNAEEAYSNAIRIKPKDPSLYVGRGDARLFLGDELNAEKDFAKAISLDKYYINHFLIRGLQKFEEKEYKVSSFYLEKAVVAYEKKDKYMSSSTFSYVLMLIGFCKYYLNDLTSACSYWNRAGEAGYKEGFEVSKKNCGIKSN